MTGEHFETYDFRANAGYTDQSQSALNSWLKTMTGVFAEHWKDVSSAELESAVSAIKSCTFDTAFSSNSQPMQGCVINIGSHAEKAMWFANHADLLTLVGQVLYGTPEEAPEDRDLTSIELSVCKMIYEYLGQSLSEAWPLQDPLEFALAQWVDNPSRSRLMGAKDEVFVAELRFRIENHNSKLGFLIEATIARSLLANVFLEPQVSESSGQTESLVFEMPLELVGVLGCAQMSMKKLADLRPGDLITLDQKIDRPLTATIDENPFANFWPGRLGKFWGIQIAEVV